MSEKSIVKTSVALPAAAHKALRLWAVSHNVSLQKVVATAVDEWMLRQGVEPQRIGS
jgi:hypothetical protein